MFKILKNNLVLWSSIKYLTYYFKFFKDNINLWKI